LNSRFLEYWGEGMKDSLVACEQAGRVFRLEHPWSTLKEARAEARGRWDDDMDRLAFQAGWVLTDTELLRAETYAATKIFSNPAAARGRAGQGRARLHSRPSRADSAKHRLVLKEIILSFKKTRIHER
jgi:hypothetical protein